MNRFLSFFFGITLPCTLCACSAKTADASYVRSARSGLLTSAFFSEKEKETRTPIPAAKAGLVASTLMSDTSKVSPGSKDDTTRDSDDPIEGYTALINSIIDLLVTDVQDLMNNSRDRSDTLNEYIQSLRREIEQGKIALRSLETQEEESDTTQRRVKRLVRELEDQLDDAIRSGESNNSSSILQELLDAQQELVTSQTQLTVAKQFQSSLSEVLGPLEERLRAVEANRDALVKGVRITDIPGVDDLGILERENGRFTIRRSTRSGGGGMRLF